MNDTVWGLLRRAEAEYGAAPAVVCGARRLTYAELARRARGLAAELLARGLAPGERVAILDWNSPLYLEATFAVAAAGAVLQPLNHRLARPELEAVLADARTRMLLHSEPFRETAAALGDAAPGLELLAAEEVSTDPAGCPDPAPGERVRPDELAHLYYTSGTSGLPKGVMLTHANVCLHARAAARELGFTAADRWGHFAPMFHLADAWASLAVTHCGGLHVIEPRFDGDAVLACIEREAVTITNLVPTMLSELVARAPARAREQGFDPSSLRRVLSGGAPISPTLVEAIEAVFRCEYVQTYGMTETSPYLTLSLLSERLRELPTEEARRYRARTGRPFATVELEVVDGSDRPVPADDRTVGEIRVRGTTVSPGYWERDEETRAAFRDGWLYTGDLAVVDGEGFVDIVDRKKDMILTGGENVFSIEVENALAEHPAVLESAVFGLPDERWGERVCARVVPLPGAQVTLEELEAHLRARLAGYKIPRDMVLCEALPKTGSGKISKATLRREAAPVRRPGQASESEA